MHDVHHDYVAVRFAPGVTTRQRKRATEGCHLQPWNDRQRLPRERFCLHRVAPGDEPREERHRRALTALQRHEHVERVATVSRLGTRRIVATERLWLRLRGRDRRALHALERRGARVLLTLEDDVLLRLPPDLDPERECRRLRELATVEHAEPDYVVVGRSIPSGLGRSDKLATGQRAMSATRTRRAWRHYTGDPDVVIAVVDDGVFAAHEDLKGVFNHIHDATGCHTTQKPLPWDAHGTGCAGLIAGRNDPRGGVKGVAAGCRLMAVRVGCTPQRLDEYVTKVSWVAAGIDWAWKHGAAVLNMSFGGGPPSRIVEAA